MCPMVVEKSGYSDASYLQIHWTPLHKAAAIGSVKLINELIDAGKSDELLRVDVSYRCEVRCTLSRINRFLFTLHHGVSSCRMGQLLFISLQCTVMQMRLSHCWITVQMPTSLTR